MEKFFVMIRQQNGLPAPMTTDNSLELALFDTYGAADEAAKGNRMACVFGYHVYRWSDGIEDDD